MSKIKMMNPDSIGKIPQQLRNASLKDGETLELITNILKHGLLQAPLVTNMVDSDGSVSKELTRVDGDRRLTACQFIKNYTPEQAKTDDYELSAEAIAMLTSEKVDEFAKIKVDVLEPMTLDEIQNRQLSANIMSKKTSDAQYIRMIHSKASAQNMTRVEIAAELGLTPERVSRLFKATKLPQFVLDTADKAKLNTTNLVTLSQLASKIAKDDEKVWGEWLERAASMDTVSFSVEVADHIEAVTKANKEARTGQKAEFEVKKSLKKKDQLEVAYMKAENAFASDPSTENEIALNIWKWIFSVTEEDVAKQRNAFEEKINNQKANAEKRKKDREMAKAKEMVKALADSGVDIVELAKSDEDK